jgi:O-methyltransferase
MFETFRQRLNTLTPRKKRRASNVTSLREKFPEASAHDLQRIAEVTPFTMTSSERLWALRRATQYVIARNIAGDFAETGVWRGGSTMLMAATALDGGDRSRGVWLYDTFEGMPEPQALDAAVQTGESAHPQFEALQTGADRSAWCDAPLEEVKANMARIGYPVEQVRYIVGKTQDTLSAAANRPARLAILRLDTDWYESTKAELEALFDLLSPGGVLIIDDYGYWAGCMRAVDEFFANREPKYLFNRIDTTGRMMVKA